LTTYLTPDNLDEYIRINRTHIVQDDKIIETKDRVELRYRDGSQHWYPLDVVHTVLKKESTQTTHD
jgi:hypothetical protein